MSESGQNLDILGETMNQRDFYQGTRGGGVAYGETNNRIALALKTLCVLPIKSLLDIGCGDGSFLNLVRQQHPDWKLTGVDINPETVAMARQAGFEAHVHNMDEAPLPLPSASFEACFSGEVIEHVFSLDDFFLETHRVLVSGGYFFLTTPNLGAWFNRISLLLGYQPVYTEVSVRENMGHLIPLPGQPAGHLRILTHRALCLLLQKTGFEVVRSFGVGMNPGSGNRAPWLVRWENILFSHPTWSSGLAVLARKPAPPHGP